MKDRIAEILRRLAFYLRRRRFESELDEEMQHHLALSGPQQFGNIAKLKEESRSMWTWTIVEQFAQDLRYSFRAMLRNKAFTALAALSLALGIGANTAIFSFTDSILLRSLPVHDPESLITVSWHIKGVPFPPGSREAGTVVYGINGSIYGDAKSGSDAVILPYPAFELLHNNSPAFSSVFAFCAAETFTVSVRGQADTASGDYVTGEYFSGLGVPPAAGRLLLPGDDQAGAPGAIVISSAFSQKHFGNPAEAPGQTILLNNVPFTIAGVTPPEFFGAAPGRSPDFYLPVHSIYLLEASSPFGLNSKWFSDQNAYWIQIMARLRPGVSLAQAQSALAARFHQWVESTAHTDRQRSDLPALVLQPGASGLDGLRRQFSKPLYLLMTVVALILVIACANIANLLLAREATRRREMAVRLSMGAARFRLIRQLLTESVLLASLGGICGVIVAFAGVRFLNLLLAASPGGFIPHADVNWHVLATAAALSVLTGIVFGLAPAIQSTRVDVTPALKEVRAGQPRARRRINHANALVASQIALSLLMLVAAGLFVRTLGNLQSVNLGFNRENLLLFQMNARKAGHGDADIVAFYRDLEQRFRAIPGVRGVSASNRPLLLAGFGQPVHLPGELSNPTTRLLTVAPEFFSSMQIPIVRGREIDERDTATAPEIAVISEKFAHDNFGDEDPLGRRLIMDGRDKREMEIVGVAREAHYGPLRREVPPVVYIPYTQGTPKTVDVMNFVLRTAGDPLLYTSTVREIVRQADARVPVTNIQTQNAQIDRAMNQEILFARLCSGFAILGLVMACVGLYGTMSYNVTRRTGEIGIRMALGARGPSVAWMVLREVLWMALAGLAIGLPVAFATSKLVSSFLFGMKPNDPASLGLAVATLIAATAIAGYVPARRATRIDPMTALRNE